MKWLEVILGLALTAYKGLVLKLLWGWFISPTFGVPNLSFWIAIGILLIVELATLRIAHINVRTDEAVEGDLQRIRITKVVVEAYTVTLILVLGFIIQFAI